MKENPSDFTHQLLARHESALQVLRDSDAEMSPLVIYLRKFDIHVMRGPTAPERQFTEETVLDALHEVAKLITIQEHPTGEQIRSAFSSRVPALSIGDSEDWKSVLRPILARGELIIQILRAEED